MGKVKSQYNFTQNVGVNVQNQTPPSFQYYLMNEQNTDITLTSNTVIGSAVVNVSAGHGFTGVTGERFVIWENNIMIQVRIKSVSVNAITLVEPVPVVFTVAGAKIVRGNINMNVDGSSTSVEYKLQLHNFTTIIHTHHVIHTMFHGANVPDDGKFGGITALTNGLYARLSILNGTYNINLGNYTRNQSFKSTGFEVEYSTKAPAGDNATNLRLDSRDIFGSVMPINPNTNDVFSEFVRDDISASAGMDLFTTSIIGRYTEW